MTTAISSLPASVTRLVERIEEQSELTPGRARRLLVESAPPAEDLLEWVDFDHPVSDSYGRRMVYDSGDFELMVMSWVPGDMSAIHDHGHTQWGAVRLYGAAEHATFRLHDGELTTADRRRCEPGTVLAVGHELIHQMGNVGNEPYLTLHLYGCTGRGGSITADARLYELFEDRVQLTDGGVFFALPETAVTRREHGPRADFPTVLRHHVELLRRLVNIDRQRAPADPADIRLDPLMTWVTTAPGSRDAAEAITRELAAGHDDRLDLLARELRAALGLQLELVDEGRLELPESGHRDRMAALLEIDQTRRFAEENLRLTELPAPASHSGFSSAS